MFTLHSCLIFPLAFALPFLLCFALLHVLLSPLFLFLFNFLLFVLYWQPHDGSTPWLGHRQAFPAAATFTNSFMREGSSDCINRSCRDVERAALQATPKGAQQRKLFPTGVDKIMAFMLYASMRVREREVVLATTKKCFFKPNSHCSIFVRCFHHVRIASRW